MRVALTPPALKRDRFCTVVSVTDTGDGDLVSFEGIDDLTAAEGITGCYVLANRDDFELDSLDAAYTDLMGREVVDERFGSLGTIVEIMSTPANDVWVVEGDRYGEVLIPVIEQVVNLLRHHLLQVTEVDHHALARRPEGVHEWPSHGGTQAIPVSVRVLAF